MASKNNNQKPNRFLMYTGLAFQLGLCITLFTYLGVWLDDKNQTSTPWFTVCFSLLGVGSGLYLSLKPLLKDE